LPPKKFSKQCFRKNAFEARLRDGRPKFRNAFKAKQNKKAKLSPEQQQQEQEEEVTAVIC